MKTLAKRIKNLKSEYAGLELRIAGIEAKLASKIGLRKQTKKEKGMKNKIGTLVLAGLALALIGCSHTSPYRMNETQLRKSYCESVSYQDSDNCVYIPVKRTDVHPCDEIDWDKPASVKRCYDELDRMTEAK